MVNVDQISTFATAPVTSTMPDSITVAGNAVWVAYTNGADSTGLFGDSTIVEYNLSGQIVQSYNIPGYVDGLKVNPDGGDIWALQNQDGNSTLTIINPETGSVSDPLQYGSGYVYGPTSSRGFDDVVFDGNRIFLSETNPANPGDPTVVELLNGHGNGLGMGSQRPLVTNKTVLTDGTLGTNTATGATTVVPQADPDSLKLAPNGDLLLTSGDDGVIIDIRNPGTPHQTVFFTAVQPPDPTVPNQGAPGLDDVIQPNATAGTFYISVTGGGNTGAGQVLKVHVTGLIEQDYYASVGSLHAFGQVDPNGNFTPLVSGLTGPHGVEFVPDANAASPASINVVGIDSAPMHPMV